MRCERGTEEGTEGFFCVGFVRDPIHIAHHHYHYQADDEYEVNGEQRLSGEDDDDDDDDDEKGVSGNVSGFESDVEDEWEGLSDIGG